MTKRLFVAAPLPKEYKENLLKSVRLYDSKNCRPTKEENLHVTVLFLGNTEESQIPEIVENLKMLAQKTKPFELCFDKVALAPPGRRKTMVWAVFKKSSSFENLIHDASESLKKYLRNQTPPNLLPHVTLARSREQPKKEPFQFSLHSLSVSSIELMSSTLKQDGSIYETVKEFSLNGG